MSKNVKEFNKDVLSKSKLPSDVRKAAIQLGEDEGWTHVPVEEAPWWKQELASKGETQLEQPFWVRVPS